MSQESLYKNMRNIAESKSAAMTSMETMRSTTVSGYRSSHGTQVFKQGIGNRIMYLVGSNTNLVPPMVQ